jgi:hypothetical protein
MMSGNGFLCQEEREKDPGYLHETAPNMISVLAKEVNLL